MAGGEWLLALVLGQESASTRVNMHSFCHAKASDSPGVDQANRRERMFWEFLKIPVTPQCPAQFDSHRGADNCAG